MSEKISPEIKAVIETLKKSHSKEKCLKQAYDILSRKYRGERIKTLFLFWRLFLKNMEKLWRQKGFLHCTKINNLLEFLLTQSGWFSQNDIQRKWTLIWYISPHQYLKIKITENEFINIDIWAKPFGIFFGDYARGFH
ncbi:MAG: hypothetical protein WCX12_02000 [Candidatus Paceibacterota bacterium]|jgi:hypothetical protein